MICFTWKYKIIVQISPKTTGGRPSTKSLAFILTSLIRLFVKKLRAVLALLKKCGLLKTLPLSTGC